MSDAVTTVQRAGLLLRVKGVVQGVGFRPFVHRLAMRHSLDGWVRNRSDGVEIAIEGEHTELDAFVVELRAGAPPLARIDDLETEVRAPNELSGFRIIRSDDVSGQRQPVAPDVVLCEACERELLDPTNRRYRYPFITCTDCGPRYSVIERMPYDRERTSMRAFTQCAACRLEYETPGDRRYHSETNSCAACGPRLRLLTTRGREQWDDAALAEAARLLLNGGILALRGLGGFHLAVDATNEAAVTRLRRAKHRDAKPFAVMVRTLADARAIADARRSGSRSPHVARAADRARAAARRRTRRAFGGTRPDDRRRDAGLHAAAPAAARSRQATACDDERQRERRADLRRRRGSAHPAA